MLSLAVAALAAATVCWPAGPGRGRLLRLGGHRLAARSGNEGPHHGPGPWRTPWGAAHGLALVAVAAGLSALLAGLGGALAAAMVAGTAGLRWRAGRDRRAGTAAATGLSDAIGVLVAELRAGAHPAEAAGAAAADAHPDAARPLAAAASAARLGGDVPAALRSTATAQLRPSLSRLADAWSLAQRHGIPLADLLDAVRVDTEARVRFAAELQARLAGPRTTAVVLAGLPLLGLALGQAVGADPLRILGNTGIGQVLLVVGTGLACAGVLWSARLTAGTARI